MEEKDPVFEEDGNWYFWVETWADYYGPFDSEEQARCFLDFYVEYHLNCPDLRV